MKTQTRRHSYLVSLIGIEHVVLAINKLDLVDYSQEVFDGIEADYRAFAAEIGPESITAIPASALRGANIIEPSDDTPWYRGPSLLEHLEAVQVSDRGANSPFRMPVQWVGEVARLMADAGLVVLVSFISPFRSERDLARELAGEGRFCEVSVDTTLAAAEARDPKGLYRKARRGELPNFTGIDSSYEEPDAPEAHIDISALEPGESAEVILERLRTMGIAPGGQTA